MIKLYLKHGHAKLETKDVLAHPFISVYPGTAVEVDGTAAMLGVGGLWSRDPFKPDAEKVAVSLSKGVARLVVYHETGERDEISGMAKTRRDSVTIGEGSIVVVKKTDVERLKNAYGSCGSWKEAK